MRRLAIVFGAGLIAVLMASGCADGSNSGALGEKCYPDGTCNPGLECVNNVCVAPTNNSNDTNHHSGPYCGDGHKDEGEECDGLDFGDVDRDCKNLGYYGGFIQCDRDKCELDYSPCYAAGKCGDGIVQEGEECDGTDFELGDGYGSDECSFFGHGEGKVTCNGDCTINFDACTGPKTCGNGVIDGSEVCDGGGTSDVFADPSDRICPPEYYGGEVHCTDNCTLDYSECKASGWCGDGIVQDGHEECEVGQLGGATCGSVGWFGGNLACAQDCSFDTSLCKVLHVVDNSTTGDGTFTFYDLAEDGDGNVIAVGFGQGNIAGASARYANAYSPLVMKFTPSGGIAWAYYIQADSGEAYGVSVDSGGNIYVVGYFTGSIEGPSGPVASNGSADGFVLKMSPDRQLRWTYTFGVANAYDVGYRLALDEANGRLFFTGFVGGEVYGNYGGGWDAVVGTLSMSTGALNSALSVQFGGADDDAAFGVTYSSGTLWISAMVDDDRNGMWDNCDASIRRYSVGSSLTLSKEYKFEGDGMQMSLDVAVDGASAYAVITSTSAINGVAPAGEQDCYVVRLNPIFPSSTWTLRLGGTHGDHCTGAVVKDGHLYVGMIAGGPLGSTTIQGDAGMAIAKVDPSSGSLISYKIWDAEGYEGVYVLRRGRSTGSLLFCGATTSSSLEGEARRSNVAGVVGRMPGF